MPIRQRLDTALTATNGALHLFAAFWLFLLAVTVLIDVLGRGLFNAPLPGTAEIIANSIVAIAFLQLSHSIRLGGMLRAEIIEPYLPKPLARLLQSFGCVLGVVLFAAVAWSAWEPMLEAWRIGEFAGNEGSLKLPTYPVRTLLVVMCVLAAVNYLVMACLVLRADREI